MQTAPPKNKFCLDCNFSYLLMLLGLSLYICWPILNDNFITTIDGGSHLLHLYCMAEFIGKGQWYVRWIPYFYGYGYPVFNYYPPLFSILGTALVKTGLSYVLALNLTCFFIVFFSGLTMYFFAKEFWGREGAFLSAVAYMVAPFLMLDLYVRGSYPEFTSFPFLPLILWAFYKLHKELSVFYLSMGSLAVAGLFLSHNCITLIFSPVVILYIVVLHFPFKRQNYTSFLISLAIFGLGMGLSAFFWLPAIIEKSFVHVDKIISGRFDFHHLFLTVQQLIYAPWPKKPGTTLPYEIGQVHCLLAIISLCFVQKIVKSHQFLVKQLIFISFVLLGAIFLTLPYSLIIWDHIPILRFLTFPARFLVLVTLMVSVLAGGATVIFGPKYRSTIMILGVLALLLINLPRCTAPYGWEKVYLKNIGPSFVFTHLHPQDEGEYLPKWVKQIRQPVPSQKLEIINGKGQILSQNIVSDLHHIYTVQTFSPSLLCFNVFYFPGWTIKVDGQLVDILKDNPFGLIIFPVDEGIHEIKADFGPTPIRRAATVITIVSFLILVGLVFFKIIRRIHV